MLKFLRRIRRSLEDYYFIGWVRAYKEGRNTLISIETDLTDETNRILQLIKGELGDEEI